MSHPANQDLIEKYNDALIQFQESNLELLKALSRAIDVIADTSKAHRNLLNQAKQVQAIINTITK